MLMTHAAYILRALPMRFRCMGDCQGLLDGNEKKLTPCVTTVAASPAILSWVPVEPVRVLSIGGCAYGPVDALCA